MEIRDKVTVEEETEAQAEAAAQAEVAAQAEAEAKLLKLIEACGEGTVFEDGACIVPEQPSVNHMPLIFGIVFAMGIGFVIMLILWGIGKRSNKKLSNDT